MNRYRSQGGVALVMVIGFVAVLLVLGTTVALVMVNDMGATSDTTARAKAFNVAEAGLDMGMFSLSSTWPSSPPAAGTPVTLSSDLRAMLPEADFPTSAGESFVTVTMSPGSDDSHMLLQSQANVAGKSVKLETMIVRQNVGLSSLVPGVALYSGRDTRISGSGTISSPLQNHTPTGSVYVYGNVDPIVGSANLSTVGLKVRGTIAKAGSVKFSSVLTQNDPTVPTFDAFLPQSQVDYLTQLSKAGPTSPPSAAVEVPNNGTIPKTAAAVHVKGKGTISGSGTYTIGSLYVDGDLSVAGSVTLNIGSLYVGGTTLDIAGSAKVNIDSLYVNGNLTIAGSVKLANLGPTWVGGWAKIAGSGQCRMPLVVAQGDVEVAGSGTWGAAGVGASVEPCIAISLTGNLKWAGSTAFYGLMAAPQGMYTAAGSGWVHGSVLAAKDADLSGSFKIAYNGDVVASIHTGSATIAKRVPGTWRQLPAE